MAAAEKQPKAKAVSPKPLIRMLFKKDMRDKIVRPDSIQNPYKQQINQNNNQQTITIGHSSYNGRIQLSCY